MFAEPPETHAQVFADSNQTIELLQRYKAGSARSDLTPIDDLVQAALGNDAQRNRLELILSSALKQNLSPEATEYVCSKLALIGTELSCPALEPFLSDPRLSTAARNALEKIPGPGVSRMLRQSCLASDGQQRAGIIHSIAERRDPLAVSFLRKLLFDQNPALISAALYALGRIGNLGAAAALRDFLPHAPLGVRSDAVEATLSCAERLAEIGQASAAKSLCNLLAGPPHPAYIRKAAAAISPRSEKNQ